MESPSVFQYQSAKRFLFDYVEQKQKADSGFSIRRWSKEIGLSHALLAMLLQGKRSMTLKQVPYFSKGMGLSSPERLYFQALIQFDNADTPEEKDLCQLWLAEVNPGKVGRIREVDEYIVIAHWVHMAILAMTDLNDFKGTAEEIHEKLEGRVAIHEIRAALERLKALNLVTEQEGRLVCSYQRITTKDDVANRGAREYHKQVAALVPNAIETQSVEEREFQSFAVSVPESKVKLAKEMIRKFRTQFYEAMTAEKGDMVYQTSIQFFRLTESPSKHGVLKEDEGTGSDENKRSKQ
ncbi:MAG: TIGR02147 family protein [Bdellovibrionales bacterium]